MTETILVTGAAGFIGSRFVERLNARGDSVIQIISADQPEHFAERTENAAVKPALAFGEIVDRENLLPWLESNVASGKRQLRAIVHLGACSATTQLDEAYLRKMNLDYSKNLWTFATKHRIPFIYASSAATYGEGELGYDDDETLIPRLKPLNPYGESKRAFDEWALAEETAGRTPPAWSGFKFFNVYGFGERHKGKMASVVLHAYDQILATGGAQLFQSHKSGVADGEQARDFIYVDDVVDVLEFALTRPLRRGVYNLGTGQARTFLDLVRATFRALGKEERIKFVPTPEHLRARYQYFTEAKMAKLRAAGYTKPFTDLEAGVARYVARLRGA